MQMRRSVVGVVCVWLPGAFALGCADSDAADAGSAAGELLSCQAADERIWEELTRPENLDSWRSCASDQDCTLEFSPLFECGERNVRFHNCAVPIATAKLDAGRALIDALEVQLCSEIMRDCRGGPLCPQVQVRCVEGQCRGVAPDAGAP